jgi:hypothetical protein
LLRAQLASGFDDSQGISTGLSDDLRRYLWVDRLADRPLKEPVRILHRQARDLQTRQGPQTRVQIRGLPDCEKQTDTVCQQPACHEAEDVGRLLVQPLRVVDHTQNRPDLGRVRQQRKHGEADQERIGRRPAHQPKRDPQRPTLRLGQPVQGREEREEQLVDTGEAESLLGLNRHHPDNLQVRGALNCIVEQCRLSHSGLTAHDQHAAHTPADAIEQLFERTPLSVAVDEPHNRDDSRDRFSETVCERPLLCRSRELQCPLTAPAVSLPSAALAGAQGHPDWWQANLESVALGLHAMTPAAECR